MAETKSRKHPKGLYQLFFIEMWERLAFYTMLNVLLLYVTDFERGGLGLPAADGNEIYGLYLAFVYFTPFPGGLLADRYLGYRKAVVIGGLIMSAGLFLMSRGETYFYYGLIGLVIGNGLFKPNISVMVGNLYEPGDPKRDAGFNIFYMGINIGAFVASFLSSAVRNKFNWEATFLVASIGLLIGVTILALSWKTLEVADRQPERSEDDTGFGEVFLKILLPAFVFGGLGFWLSSTYMPDGPVRPAIVGFLAGMIPIIVFFVRLGVTAVDKEKPGLLALLPIYVAGGTFFMVLHLNGSAMTQWANDMTARDIPAPSLFQQDGLPSYYGNAAEDVPRPSKDSLVVVDDASVARMYGQKRMDHETLAEILAANPELSVEEFDPLVEVTKLDADKAAVWQFSTAIYPDGELEVVEGTDSHGAPTVAVNIPEQLSADLRVALMREGPDGAYPTYVVSDETYAELYEGYAEKFGHPPEELPPGKWVQVINPELFQSLNALFVVGFTPLIVGFFAWLVARGKEISTARKIFYGLCLTTASLLLMALGGMFTDGGAAKVSGLWLVGFYGIITIGELLLSPMGLSLVTKLAPKRLVGLAMGGWFLATAFGNNFSGFFGGIQSSMTPVNFFLVLAGIAAAVALFIYVLLDRLDDAINKSTGGA
ncbi:Di-/tripeptide transporter [Enhygromyxa salina]|uniref:Di-/tripeptide transporter n=1 Tax=Enhygromyxa salina TaxID=215803 RepID=A0A2S9YEL6_9BACT|nr:peptide MFS transporter [Enhygromyxa salina]PRQ03543.1 Di-/tripeptide transporter [Enhygromyxa salina]